MGKNSCTQKVHLFSAPSLIFATTTTTTTGKSTTATMTANRFLPHEMLDWHPSLATKNVNFSNVRCFRIGSNHAFSFAGKNFSRLEELQCHSASVDLESALQSVQFPALRTLVWTSDTCVADDTTWWNHATQLETLVVRDCAWNVTKYDRHALTKLSLQACHVSDLALQGLSTSAHLRQLEWLPHSDVRSFTRVGVPDTLVEFAVVWPKDLVHLLQFDSGNHSHRSAKMHVRLLTAHEKK